MFRAIRPLEPGDLVRGQYRGYRKEKGVAPDSTVETFAARAALIDSWRWEGVPFSSARASACRDRDRGAGDASSGRRSPSSARRDQLLPLPAEPATSSSRSAPASSSRARSWCRSRPSSRSSISRTATRWTPTSGCSATRWTATRAVRAPGRGRSGLGGRRSDARELDTDPRIRAGKLGSARGRSAGGGHRRLAQDRQVTASGDRVEVFASRDALASAALSASPPSAGAAIGARGRFVVALSGGVTPRRALRLGSQPSRMPPALTGRESTSSGPTSGRCRRTIRRATTGWRGTPCSRRCRYDPSTFIGSRASRSGVGGGGVRARAARDLRHPDRPASI